MRQGRSGMYRVAIVEDMERDQERLISYLEKFEEEENVKFDIKTWGDANSFLMQYRPVYDMIFLDIELPNMSGMTAAYKIREIDFGVVLVFTTNLSQFAVKSYDVNALDYMVKPYSYPVFFMKMKKVVKYLSKEKDPTVSIQTKTGLKCIPVSHIEYIEVRLHQLFYHTEEEMIEVRGSLKDIESVLLPLHFLRCNNCYLVNLRHVKSVIGNDVVVGNTTLPISRPKRKNFVDGLTAYLGV